MSSVSDIIIGIWVVVLIWYGYLHVSSMYNISIKKVNKWLNSGRLAKVTWQNYYLVIILYCYLINNIDSLDYWGRKGSLHATQVVNRNEGFAVLPLVLLE